VAIDRLEVSAGQTYLSAAGDLPLENRAALSSVEESLVFSLTGDLLDVAQAAALASAARGSERVIAGGTGPLVLVARVAGSVASPAVTAALDIGPATVEVRPDLPAVEALRVRATLDGGEIDLSEVSGTYQGARLTAQGQGPLALFTGGTPGGGGEATLRATASGITSAILKPFVGAGVADEIAGGLDARLELSTPSLTLEGLHGDLVLDRLDVSVASLPIRQRVPTRVVVRDGLARVEAWDWAGANGSLTVQGQVNLADRLVSLLADGQLDARLLTPFLRDAGLTTAGRVRTRLSVSGALADPTLNGDLQLSDGELRLAAPRVVASDVDARATLARGRLYVSSLSGSVNGGRLSGSGRVQYAPTLDVRLTTTVEGMALEFPAGLRSELDTSLQLSATAVAEQPATATLTGEVTIRRGAYREPLSLVTGVLANLRRSTTAPGTVAGPSALEWLTLDVRVVTDEDLVVQNNVARAQLGADLRVINSAAAPSLSGRAELREGGQLYLGRNVYTVQSGTIDFANPTTIEPILGIEASTKVSGVDIDIQLSGPPDTLTTALSSPSDPELGQSDLASLLLTGRRLENTDAGQAAAVGAQLAGSVAGDVLGLAGRAIGFDTVRVGAVETTSSRDPAELASQTDPTSRLTFGKSFGSNLDVTLSQSLVDSGAQTWIIDYLPVRRVALRFVSDDDELRSYEFRHEIVFGAPSSIRSGEASREAPLLRVSSVRFTGEPGFPEPELRAQLQLREQDRFDFISWQDDRDRLERFYHGQHRLTATIRAGRRVTPAGVDLTYEIAAGPETRVRVSGAQLDRRALEEIETAWARAVLDAFVVDEVQAIVRRALAQAGDYEASVRVCLADAEAIRTLVVDVVPGTRVERVDVRLEGVTDALRGELTSARDAPAAAIAMEAPDRYAQQLEDALRQRGYLRASVSVTRPSMEGAAAVVPVTVDPGRQYHVGVVDVRVGGPSEDVRAEAGLTTGDVYRDTEVESARTRLQGQYRQEGYVTAAVDVERLVREDEGLVDVTYVVREGPRQTIAEVTVAGNVSVDEDVVLSALRLKVGQALKAADWLQARRRLFESGLFRRVDIGVEPLGGALDSAPVRLRVVVEEWPALRLRYGLQVAQERPEDESGGTELEPGFSADVTRRTLFGRAITIGAAGQYQKRERVARIFLSTPSLFGWPVRSSVTLERSREEPAGLDSIFDKTIASWEQRIRTGPTGVSYGMRFERNLTRETNPPIGLPAYEVTAHIGLLTVGLASDTRDDPADATRGLFVTSTLEQAPSALGSDYPFVRSLSQVYRFQSWKGVVLASTARYGVMRALGGGVVFPSQQFRAGGARTVRGVPEDGLGIGTSMLIFNQETRFPIYRWVRGVGFFDAGNVFAEPADLSLGQLVGSVGVGLRVVTPFVLLRVDYGRTIWNRPFEDSGRWVFGIGQAF
jgi:outer membrane protein assembly factor BamA